MKILMTTDTVGGVWTYAIDLARGLAPGGAEIALATMGNPLSADQRAQAESLDNVRVYESQFKLEWMTEPWNDVKLAGQWLFDLERDFKPELVHLNGFAHASLGFSGPVVVVGHSCVCSWWEACRGEPAPPEWDRYRQETQLGLQHADVVVAPTRAMLAALRRHYQFSSPACVIPNGRSRLPYHADIEKEPLILSAGRLWDEAKNIAAIGKAAAGLPWPTYVAGETRHPDGGGAPTGTATFLGKLDEQALADWYSRASIYALPARYEPFGLSVLEAALSGCALVLGDIRSLRENWDGAALFVNPSDPSRLHRSFLRLIEDGQLLRSLARSAGHRADHLSLEGFAKAYLSLYRTTAINRSVLACAL